MSAGQPGNVAKLLQRGDGNQDWIYGFKNGLIPDLERSCQAPAGHGTKDKDVDNGQ